LYFIFALWNSPLALLGVAGDLTGFPNAYRYIDPIVVVWAKLLVVIFFVLSVRRVYEIGQVFSGNDRDATLVAVTFGTAPIAIFAVFILGQYDIIGLYFALTGYLYYIKRNALRFVLFFSVAICFKYFALVIFVPLLLISEKRWSLLALNLAAAIFPTILQVALYWSNDAFRDSFLALPLRTLRGGGGEIGFAFLFKVLLLAVYALLCIWAYRKHIGSPREMHVVSLSVVLTAYLMMFYSVHWHPQWLIILFPFSALAIYFVRWKGLFLLGETIGMALFCLVVVGRWPANVDSSMLLNGLFGGLFSAKRMFLSDVLPYSSLVYIAFNFCLAVPLILLYLSAPLSTASRNGDSEGRVALLARLRFASLLLFVIPAILVSFVPEEVALRFNNEASLRGMKIISDHASSVRPVGEICCGRTLVQEFVADADGLSAVGFLAATYQRTNTSLLVVSVVDHEGRVIVTRDIQAREVKDNQKLVVRFGPVQESKGHKFSLHVSSADASPGNSITAWLNLKPPYWRDVVTLGGEKEQGALVLTQYFVRQDRAVLGSGLFFWE
jgi:hypothetical protein